jgi:aryl-alcohol dehydrogenase-like predicted oxidoreductase
VVLATKLYGSMGDWPNTGKLSALNIRRACDASLMRLKTDYIDLYQMHHVDRETSWEEIWQAMEQLVREGRFSTWAAATSPDGTSCRPTRRLGDATSWGW